MLNARVKADAGDADPPLLLKTSAPGGGIVKLDARRFRIDIATADTAAWPATMYAWSASRVPSSPKAVLGYGNLNLKECA